MERTRRRKLHRAREGALVGGHAPFGYRWVKRNETSRARLEPLDYQAAIIRRIYQLLVDELLSTRSIARRLTRKAIYQGLVLEEMEKAGVRAEFLNYPVDDSPDSKMLLGMQVLFAEYERAKIMERTRRGKLHRAREGALVGGHAPFGYRWVKRNETSRARLEPLDYQAAIIRRIYQLLVDELLSTRSIARRLTEEGIPTSRGAVQWQPTAVSRMLTNPVYKGSYRYRQSGQEEILIPVPPLMEVVTWQAAQVQLLANSQYSKRNKGASPVSTPGLGPMPQVWRELHRVHPKRL